MRRSEWDGTLAGMDHDIDWNEEIRHQVEWHWSNQLRPRLDGLTDEEYQWRPVDEMWTAGEFTVPPPEPAPVTTIAWRLSHLVFLLEAGLHRFGGPAVDFAGFTHPRTAAEAIRRLDASYQRWVQGVARSGTDQLVEPAGPAGTPMADWSTARIVLHTHREIIHHGAEICLLRDLHRAGLRHQPGRSPIRPPGAMKSGVFRSRGDQVPLELRARLTLRRVDYVDQHVLTVDGADSWSAEDWARAMFEDAQPAASRARQLGLLGLLLSRPRPSGRVAGWTVASQDAHHIRLQSEAASTRDEVLVTTDTATVSLLTAVEYRSRIGAVTWPVLARLHRRFAVRVLRRARTRLSTQRQ